MQEIWNSICLTVTSYGDCYYDLIINEWQHMTPMKYLALLLTIGIVGYMSMRNGLKRI